ncbi:CAP domain-containing protein, partial [Halenospora varia]
LTWSDKLSAQAQAYAEHLLSINHMEHSPSHTRKGQGENLYVHKSRTPTTFLRAVERWVDEVVRYNGEVIRHRREGGQIDKNGDRFGHYTQIIWPSTREVGMGMARREDGKTFVVARYEPVGNRVGQSAWDYCEPQDLA